MDTKILVTMAAFEQSSCDSVLRECFKGMFHCIVLYNKKFCSSAITFVPLPSESATVPCVFWACTLQVLKMSW